MTERTDKKEGTSRERQKDILSTFDMEHEQNSTNGERDEKENPANI